MAVTPKEAGAKAKELRENEKLMVEEIEKRIDDQLTGTYKGKEMYVYFYEGGSMTHIDSRPIQEIVRRYKERGWILRPTECNTGNPPYTCGGLIREKEKGLLGKLIDIIR